MESDIRSVLCRLWLTRKKKRRWFIVATTAFIAWVRYGWMGIGGAGGVLGKLGFCNLPIWLRSTSVNQID